MRRIVTAISGMALALSMVASAVPANAAVPGYDSAYLGQSDWLVRSQGQTGSWTVIFQNTGTTTWTRGTSTEVEYAACLDDKVTCNAQDADEAAFNNGWVSAVRYADMNQTAVAPGQAASFTVNIQVPATAAAGIYRFNGAVVKADTGADIHNEGAFFDVNVPGTAAAQGLTITPASDTNQTGTNHTVTVTYTNAAGAPIANASIDFFVVNDTTDPFTSTGGCNVDTNATPRTTGTDACKIDITDPITNSDGKATFTFTSNAKETHRVIAWTGNSGETFDNDTTTLKVSATKTWIGAVGALDATPETKNNPFGSTHTVTAQLIESGTTTVALAGQTIRFEVYRGGLGDPNAANGNNGCSGLTVFSLNSAQTDATGKATFSYTGPADPSTSTGSSINDCIFVWYDADNDGVRDAAADEETDTVNKTWLDTAATTTTVTLSPSDDGNPTSSTHSVTATVTDQFGNAVSGVVVRFRVSRTQQTDTTAGPEGVVLTADRTTGSDGKATLAYTGPTYGSNDSITGEADKDADGVFGEGEPTSAAVTKHWAPEAAASGGTNYTGTIIFCDTANDTVYVNVATGPANNLGNRRFIYDSGDQFFLDGTVDTTINGTPTTMATWESKCTDGDTVTINYVPGGVSQFENETDAP